MEDYSSPSKIPKIHHPEADVIHDRLQLLAYKCHDPTVNPRETGQQLCTLATDVMAIMSRWQKQKQGLQQTVQSLRTELNRTKRQLAEAQGSAELLAATKDFCKDDLNHVATQTDAPSAENADTLNSSKEFGKDDLHDTTQALPVEDGDA
ncbi:hypothetical protein R3I93_004671 [Phoxinus phoxinus]|uniref:Uncharacterized protein n=1 Tax=Phoxinus phoxinus TaxID=58324 RepID=A0AAN9DFR0_9TELE